jgi:hypothetical protein
MPDNLTAGYPPLARLSSSVEDRRGEGLPGMLLSYARGQLTPEKLRMVMAHPMLGPVARANLINAQQSNVAPSSLGDALGMKDPGLR